MSHRFAFGPVTACAVCLTFGVAAWADSACTDADRAKDVRAAQAAVALERQGKMDAARQAIFTARRSECVPTASLQEMGGAWSRVTLALGQRAEKAGKLLDAKREYAAGEHKADAKRAMKAYMLTGRDEATVLDAALAFFRDAGHEDAAAVDQALGLARAGTDRWLEAEDKVFAGGRGMSLKELERAASFARLTGDADDKRVRERSARRGDARVKSADAPKRLEEALAYYHFADARDKAEAVKPVARRLGEAAQKKGEHRIAEAYYAISGDDARIEAMEKSREAGEAKRQKDFKKGADDLERELKM